MAIYLYARNDWQTFIYAFATVNNASHYHIPVLLASAPTEQCLHFDPDCKLCLMLHLLLKSFDRSFAQLEDLECSQNWSGVVKLLTAKALGKDKGQLLVRYEVALWEHTSREKVLPL
jgi:DnaJ family protein C protein 3